MAIMSSPKLSITLNSKSQTVLCRVDCAITFTSFERSLIKAGLQFRLDCTLFGDDVFNDDKLHRYGTQYFSDATSNKVETVSFVAELPKSVLNEDWGTDEVYAKVSLKDTYSGHITERKSNNVTGRF